MTDLQLIILSASIMKAKEASASNFPLIPAIAGDLIDDAQTLLLEAYKREIAHRNHLTPKDGCFVCQMNALLNEAQENAPRPRGPLVVKPS